VLFRSQTQDEIYQTLKEVLIELFEIDPARIHRQARLYEELDIDSIDAIDLVLKLKELTGRKINAEEFKHVRTVDDIVVALHGMLHA
jgi:acyl carrier protein